VTGPHFPLVPQVAEGSPLKASSHAALQTVPGWLFAPQSKVPLPGLGGLKLQNTACGLHLHTADTDMRKRAP
jgi:hypothetical protein